MPNEDLLSLQDLQNAELDAASFAKFINDSATIPNPGQPNGTLTTRLGRTYFNLAAVSARFPPNFVGGNLTDVNGIGVGTSTITGLGRTVQIHNGDAANSSLHLTNSDTGSTETDGSYIHANGSDLEVRNREAGSIEFFTNNALRGTINSDGAYGLNVAPVGGNSVVAIANLSGQLGTQINFRNAATTDAFVGLSADGNGNFVTSLGTVGSVVFSTQSLERVRVHGSSGDLLVNKSASDFTATGVEARRTGDIAATATSRPVLLVNRQATDGMLVDFRQDNVGVGDISVSGTTVSYNGGNISRWSQLPGADPTSLNDRIELYKGTVMTNVDQMIKWRKTRFKVTEVDAEGNKVVVEKTVAYVGDKVDGETTTVVWNDEEYVGVIETEVNEQLNHTEVSKERGDKNVAGVFIRWDDDDGQFLNDFYLAMTGDFVIRVAADCEVETGDLLMSAGDGTACPQDGELADAVRSCTVAKVIATEASAVYPDGSRAIPCVLMAC